MERPTKTQSQKQLGDIAQRLVRAYFGDPEGFYGFSLDDAAKVVTGILDETKALINFAKEVGVDAVNEEGKSPAVGMDLRTAAARNIVFFAMLKFVMQNVKDSEVPQWPLSEMGDFPLFPARPDTEKVH